MSLHATVVANGEVFVGGGLVPANVYIMGEEIGAPRIAMAREPGVTSPVRAFSR